MSMAETWAAWGLPDAVLNALISAAWTFHAAAPWTVLSNEEALRITDPTDANRRWTLSVLGAGKQYYGIAARVQEATLAGGRRRFVSRSHRDEYAGERPVDCTGTTDHRHARGDGAFHRATRNGARRARCVESAAIRGRRVGTRTSLRRRPYAGARRIPHGSPHADAGHRHRSASERWPSCRTMPASTHGRRRRAHRSWNSRRGERGAWRTACAPCSLSKVSDALRTNCRFRSMAPTALPAPQQTAPRGQSATRWRHSPGATTACP